jgi:Tfp pilus assembly protein PilN
MLVIVAGMVVVLLLLGYWLLLGTRITAAEDELSTVQAQNAQLQVQIDELQNFQLLADELAAKRQSLATVMLGDVSWPSLLTEVALVVPGEIWLTGFTGSAARTEGETPVATEAAEVRINKQEPTGRISFQGRSLSMPGIAKWLIRLGQVRAFKAVYLNNAAEVELDGALILEFDSSVELGPKGLSERFQGGQE